MPYSRGPGDTGHKSQAVLSSPGTFQLKRNASGETVPPTKAQREGAEEASGAHSPKGRGLSRGRADQRTCGVGCRVGPGGCVCWVLTMGQIEWAMWANEQALASGLSE